MYSHHFYNGNSICDFLFAFLDHSLTKIRSTLTEKNLLLQEQILEHIDKGGKKEDDRAVSPERVSIHLKLFYQGSRSQEY